MQEQLTKLPPCPRCPRGRLVQDDDDVVCLNCGYRENIPYTSPLEDLLPKRIRKKQPSHKGFSLE